MILLLIAYNSVMWVLLSHFAHEDKKKKDDVMLPRSLSQAAQA